MALILFMIIFLLINIGLLAFARWTEMHSGGYDTMFCRNVRVTLGRFVSIVMRGKKVVDNYFNGAI